MDELGQRQQSHQLGAHRRGHPLRAPRARQRGVGAVGLVLLLVVLGFASVVAMRLVPIYFEARAVGAVLEQLARDPELRGRDPGTVRDALDRRLQREQVSRVGAEDAEFERTADGLRVIMAWEARTPVAGNVTLVVSFEEAAEIPR